MSYYRQAVFRSTDRHTSTGLRYTDIRIYYCVGAGNTCTNRITSDDTRGLCDSCHIISADNAESLKTEWSYNDVGYRWRRKWHAPRQVCVECFQRHEGDVGLCADAIRHSSSLCHYHHKIWLQPAVGALMQSGDVRKLTELCQRGERPKELSPASVSWSEFRAATGNTVPEKSPAVTTKRSRGNDVPATPNKKPSTMIREEKEDHVDNERLVESWFADSFE